MKINLEIDITGFQEARKLRLILEHYAHSDIADKTTHLFIESLLQELDEYLANPEFEKFNHSIELDTSFLESEPKGNSLLTKLSSLRRMLTGPSKHELLLSKQRQELIERAERAEIMAFEALSETADVGRQRDETLKKVHQLEEKLNALKQTS